MSLLRRVIELKPDHEEAGAQLDALLASQDPEAPPSNEGFLKKFFGRS